MADQRENESLSDDEEMLADYEEYFPDGEETAVTTGKPNYAVVDPLSPHNKMTEKTQEEEFDETRYGGDSGYDTNQDLSGQSAEEMLDDYSEEDDDEEYDDEEEGYGGEENYSPNEETDVSKSSLESKDVFRIDSLVKGIRQDMEMEEDLIGEFSSVGFLAPTKQTPLESTSSHIGIMAPGKQTTQESGTYPAGDDDKGMESLLKKFVDMAPVDVSTYQESSISTDADNSDQGSDSDDAGNSSFLPDPKPRTAFQVPQVRHEGNRTVDDDDDDGYTSEQDISATEQTRSSPAWSKSSLHRGSIQPPNHGFDKDDATSHLHQYSNNTHHLGSQHLFQQKTSSEVEEHEEPQGNAEQKPSQCITNHMVQTTQSPLNELYAEIFRKSEPKFQTGENALIKSSKFDEIQESSGTFCKAKFGRSNTFPGANNNRHAFSSKIANKGCEIPPLFGKNHVSSMSYTNGGNSISMYQNENPFSKEHTSNAEMDCEVGSPQVTPSALLYISNTQQQYNTPHLLSAQPSHNTHSTFSFRAIHTGGNFNPTVSHNAFAISAEENNAIEMAESTPSMPVEVQMLMQPSCGLPGKTEEQEITMTTISQTQQQISVPPISLPTLSGFHESESTRYSIEGCSPLAQKDTSLTGSGTCQDSLVIISQAPTAVADESEEPLKPYSAPPTEKRSTVCLSNFVTRGETDKPSNINTSTDNCLPQEGERKILKVKSAKEIKQRKSPEASSESTCKVVSMKRKRDEGEEMGEGELTSYEEEEKGKRRKDGKDEAPPCDTYVQKPKLSCGQIVELSSPAQVKSVSAKEESSHEKQTHNILCNKKPISNKPQGEDLPNSSAIENERRLSSNIVSKVKETSEEKIEHVDVNSKRKCPSDFYLPPSKRRLLNKERCGKKLSGKRKGLSSACEPEENSLPEEKRNRKIATALNIVATSDNAKETQIYNVSTKRNAPIVVTSDNSNMSEKDNVSKKMKPSESSQTIKQNKMVGIVKPNSRKTCSVQGKSSPTKSTSKQGKTSRDKDEDSCFTHMLSKLVKNTPVLKKISQVKKSKSGKMKIVVNNFFSVNITTHKGKTSQ